MPCQYSSVILKNKNSSKQRQKKRSASKKKSVISSVTQMGFKVSLKAVEGDKTFILGEDKDGKKIEIMFDNKTGIFVTHFNGVPTHDEEHLILDNLIAILKNSFDVEVEHYHDKPKLPEITITPLAKPEKHDHGHE